MNDDLDFIEADDIETTDVAEDVAENTDDADDVEFDAAEDDTEV